MHDGDLETSISLHTVRRCMLNTVALLRYVAFASLFGLRLMSSTELLGLASLWTCTRCVPFSRQKELPRVLNSVLRASAVCMCSDEDVYLSDPSDDEESKSVDVGPLQL